MHVWSKIYKNDNQLYEFSEVSLRNNNLDLIIEKLIKFVLNSSIPYPVYALYNFSLEDKSYGKINFIVNSNHILNFFLTYVCHS